MSRDELVVLANAQAVQITVLSTQLAELDERFEQMAAKLARLEHLLSRNSDNSSFPSSKDGGPGGTPPPSKERRAKPGGRVRGKQPGAPGSTLRWYEPEEVVRQDCFPQGACQCGADLADGTDLGVVDRYQQHEIPLVSVAVTQYDQHAVACACGKLHTAGRPPGRRGRPGRIRAAPAGLRGLSDGAALRAGGPVPGDPDGADRS